MGYFIFMNTLTNEPLIGRLPVLDNQQQLLSVFSFVEK